jgi:hypothetical protein
MTRHASRFICFSHATGRRRMILIDITTLSLMSCNSISAIEMRQPLFSLAFIDCTASRRPLMPPITMPTPADTFSFADYAFEPADEFTFRH